MTKKSPNEKCGARPTNLLHRRLFLRSIGKLFGSGHGAALTEGLAFPESGGPRWWLGQSQARCPRRGLAARTTSFLQTVQFQNPGDFRDRFWIRESSVASWDHEF
jgi:hypothetical protein